MLRYFKRKIRDSDVGSSNFESDFEIGKKKKKVLSDDCDAILLINGEVSKLKISKLGLLKSAVDVILFFGFGRLLNLSIGLYNINNEFLFK